MGNFIFVGFSTLNTEYTGRNQFTDLNIIERDLMNAFQTRVGERCMRPLYGCRLWDWVMEPMTPDLEHKVQEEVQRICQSDSRVEFRSLNLIELTYGYRVEVELFYIPLNIVGIFTQDFENRQDDLSGGNLS